MENDPSENDNLAKKQPAVVKQLDEKLKGWVNNHPPRHTSKAEDATVSRETVEGLKALGYIQ
jgi:hypothetical protein